MATAASGQRVAGTSGPVTETDVLVVGIRPGRRVRRAVPGHLRHADVCVVTKYGAARRQPRGRTSPTSARMETLRDMGVEDTPDARGHPLGADGQHHVLHQPGRRGARPDPVLGHRPRRHADYLLRARARCWTRRRRSPSRSWSRAAQARGAKVRFDTEYLSHVQDGDGVTTTVRDRLTGAEYTIRSRYLVGADGARSEVAADLGLPFEGPGAVGGALGIIFEADLTRFVAHRPSVLYWMLQPGAEKEGVGLGVLRMIKPWTEWMLMWGYAVADGPPELTDEFVRELAGQLVGTDDFEMQVTVGLAVDGQPPLRHHDRQGPGVLRRRRRAPAPADQRAGLQHLDPGRVQPGVEARPRHRRARPGPALLDSYDAERAPVARQIVERANQSIADTGRIMTALGLTDTTDVDALERQLAAAQGARARGGEDPARACGRPSPTSPTSSTRTASSTTIGTPRPRSSPTARRCPPSPATPSCTPRRPPGPAPSCRTPG